MHVAHSFGSFLTNALIATTPQLSDATILTGFASGGGSGLLLEAFALRIAQLQAPGKWPGRDNEYVTWADAVANVAVFFRGGSYSEEVLWHTEDIKQPIAVAELITVGSEQLLPTRSPGYTKPLMVCPLASHFI